MSVLTITSPELLSIRDALLRCTEELEGVAEDTDWVTTSGAEDSIVDALGIIDSILIREEIDLDDTSSDS